MRFRDWRLFYTRRAERDLRNLDNVIASRVTRAINYLVDEGASGDVGRIQGHDDEWRLRVGDWRVRFTANFEERSIVILRILHRGAAYRN
ncbi:MAG: type II toxin-antitoxin system RelE/ParE family toxin [Chloroflexi bacterium]|nr:type II toxin-antitoxin system RelE/ParE family toxin [Chloroflexota bacterium]